MGKGKTNRRKGHNYERKLCKEFKELGYVKCQTTRNASRLLDSCKVDLAFIPFLVQAKYETKAIRYKPIFDQMEELIKKKLPEDRSEKSYPKAIFHRRGRKKNQEIVVMPKEDFYKLLKRINNNENGNIK